MIRCYRNRKRLMLCAFKIFILHVCVAVVVGAQPKYRTFSQNDLAEKKAEKFGKRIGTIATFTFRNDSTYSVSSLHAKFNSKIEAVQDSGGFTTLSLRDDKAFDASGRVVGSHDSVVMSFVFHKKDGNVEAEKWWWDTSGVRIGPKFSDLQPNTPVLILIGEPNGGTVRDYLYKRVVRRPDGIVIGIARSDSAKTYGWIRYMTADRKYFPHTDSARCFDLIVSGEGMTHPFVGQLRNPHVKKHNNRLLGETHALKLAIVANDSGVTEPLDSGATLFGNLIYNDTTRPGDPCNGLTIRQITHLADSALTYCGKFAAAFYGELDSCVSRINAAFGGDYVADSFSPLVIAGTHSLSEVTFLHSTPSATPVVARRPGSSLIEEIPERFEMRQNYPNPFNPSTTIEFNLPEQSIVTLKIYNTIGQEVATLLNREEMEEGEQSVEFDAVNLSSGVYFYKLFVQGLENKAHQFQSVKRMLLMK